MKVEELEKEKSSKEKEQKNRKKDVGESIDRICEQFSDHRRSRSFVPEIVRGPLSVASNIVPGAVSGARASTPLPSPLCRLMCTETTLDRTIAPLYTAFAHCLPSIESSFTNFPSFPIPAPPLSSSHHHAFSYSTDFINIRLNYSVTEEFLTRNNPERGYVEITMLTNFYVSENMGLRLLRKNTSNGSARLLSFMQRQNPTAELKVWPATIRVARGSIPGRLWSTLLSVRGHFRVHVETRSQLQKSESPALQ
ncbi:hypothetical protein HZH68_015294 [Vespula germanica]|uniref:Uncharacterized protein n=1 Tax=Vespula germanica TaxID=30212 RepID=A0A834J6L0_VESGE|nr:hypothetical protein HZH68_015294 [Vespula germanica]